MLAKYGITIAYNVIRLKIQFIVDNPICPDHFLFKNALPDNAEISNFDAIADLSEQNRLKITRSKAQIISIANSNAYNPIVEYCTEQKWDGKDRIKTVCDCLIVKPEYEAWRDIALKKMCFSMIGAAINDEEKAYSFKGSLVLQGAQGIGKSPFFKILTKGVKQYFLGEFTYSTNDKDSLIQVSENWLVELGELDATFKLSSISALKSLLTASKDVYRMPYASINTVSPRRTIFVGTVNPREFLMDLTGNDRFWPLPIESILLDKLEGINLQQLWAQIYVLVDRALTENSNKWPWRLNTEEQALMREVNQTFRQIDSIEEELNGYFSDRNKPLNYHGNANLNNL